MSCWNNVSEYWDARIMGCQNNEMSEWWDVGRTGCPVILTHECVGIADVSLLRHRTFPTNCQICRNIETSNLWVVEIMIRFRKSKVLKFSKTATPKLLYTLEKYSSRCFFKKYENLKKICILGDYRWKNKNNDVITFLQTFFTKSSKVKGDYYLWKYTSIMGISSLGALKKVSLSPPPDCIFLAGSACFYFCFSHY